VLKPRQKILGDIFHIAKDQFLPFILFWLAILLIRLHPLGGLISLAFINGEWAVRFWIAKGYCYFTAYCICIIAANVDLAMWFWLFSRGRFVLECVYPKAGRWFVQKFDPRQYDVSNHDGKFKHSLKLLARKLTEVFNQHQRTGLFLMGMTPSCGILVGVPTAVGYKVKYGFWFMALGNAIKIIVLGYVIAHRMMLIGLAVFIVLLVILLKKPRKV